MNVLLVAYNRPQLTLHQVQKLSELSRDLEIVVFAAVDGPARPEDEALVQQSRNVIAQSGLVPQERLRLSRENLGCGLGVSSAISWFFDQVGDGVVLEDDCSPSHEFLEFAGWGLRRFAHDTAVGIISGYTPIPDQPVRAAPPVALSRYPQIWGWATWRRTWDGYRLRGPFPIDSSLRSSPQWCSLPRIEKWTWLRHFRQSATSGTSDNWDVQLVYHLWSRAQFAVLPSVPLVDNVGFGGDATHTRDEAPEWYRPIADPATRRRMIRELADVTTVDVNGFGDAWLSRNLYSPSIATRLRARLSTKRNIPW